MTDVPSSAPALHLRENVWHVDTSAAVSLLRTTDATYEVPTDAALHFLKIRSHVTAGNSLETISRRSGVPTDECAAILASLWGAGLFTERMSSLPTEEEVRRRFQSVCRLWADELASSYVGNELARGDLSRTVLLGWLVEMYHYIADFPHAIAASIPRSEGELQRVLVTYADQERGHEAFVLKTLENLGMSADEVRSSQPLLSTRLIAVLLREIFELEPSSVLLVAALVEAQDFDADAIATFEQQLLKHYAVPPAALAPYFQHQAVDVSLRHAELLNDNISLLNVATVELADSLVNKLHDIKHAFELQSLEIKAYYSDLAGRYFPRQPMTFSAL